MHRLYKLKHIPTGLFFTPSNGSGNLSKTGKIYIDRLPNLKWVETIRVRFYNDRIDKKTKLIIEHFGIDLSKNAYVFDQYFGTQPNDWEIIELE